MSEKQRKVKPPRPPRCLCNSIFDWVFGIVSPSKYYFYAGKTNREREKVEQYFAQMRAYNAYLWAQRVAARIVTKDEWRQHYRQQRIEEQQLRANQSMQESMEKLSTAALAIAKEMEAAVIEAVGQINAQLKK